MPHTDMDSLDVYVCVVQVYCNLPPSVAERERALVEEVVRAECCPQSLNRVQKTGAKVVRQTVQ